MSVSESDWINDFMDFTDGSPSPDIFRLWSAITAISAMLERKVYTYLVSNKPVFANIYTLLVAPPGIGKDQAIGPVVKLWYETGKIHVSPNSMTKAAVVDALRAAERHVLPPGGKGAYLDYHSLTLPCAELGNLIHTHDLELLSLFNSIYDNPPHHREQRRHFNEGKSMDIIYPNMTILAGTQPGFLANVLPEEAWSMGFSSRILMIYSSTGHKIKLFSNMTPKTAQEKNLKERLMEMSELVGHCLWDEEAVELFKEWYNSGCQPVPSHMKLLHYIPRRFIHLTKLAMISAVSRGKGLAVYPEDFLRAQGWLLDAEERMPNIFKDMSAKSDVSIITEFHKYLWGMFHKDKKLIHESKLFWWLSSHVQAEKTQKIIEVMEKAGLIERNAGTEMWKPLPSKDIQ